MDTGTLDILSLTTTTGIIGATMFIVEILKKVFAGYAGFNKVPVFVYACAVAAILAFFANHVIYISGQPLLTGANVWIAMWRAVIGAAAASGFYTWKRNPETPATASKTVEPINPEQEIPVKKSQILPILLALILLTGCSACPEKTVLRESLAQAVAPAMAENIDLVDRIANGKPLPKFIPSDVQIRKDNQTKVNELITTDRTNDTNKGFFGIGASK